MIVRIKSSVQHLCYFLNWEVMNVVHNFSQISLKRALCKILHYCKIYISVTGKNLNWCTQKGLYMNIYTEVHILTLRRQQSYTPKLLRVFLLLTCSVESFLLCILLASKWNHMNIFLFFHLLYEVLYICYIFKYISTALFLICVQHILPLYVDAQFRLIKTNI